MSGMNPDAMAALAVELIPRVAQGLVESPEFLGAMAAGIDQVLSQKFEARMTTASNNAQSAFKHLKERIRRKLQTTR